MWMHGFGFDGMLLGWFFWLVVVAGVVVLVVWAVRRPARGPVSGCCSGSALEVLGQRYARGEITREQYEQMKKDLNG